VTKNPATTKRNKTLHTPLQTYFVPAKAGDSSDEYVSDDEYDGARRSDEEDARSILYDIDTQWGMMPQGGAYKDSNHYYGTGMYDFY
jgi:hypothetical protein